MMPFICNLPEWVKKPLLRIRALAYYGSGRYCPVCNKSSGSFRAYGINPRKDAQCAHCLSLERHRFLWLFLQSKTDFFDGQPKKMLHVAPESCFEPVVSG